jgi:hypothetical protein
MHDANAADARETSQSRSATDGGSALPDVVTAEEWRKARDALLVKEKRAIVRTSMAPLSGRPRALGSQRARLHGPGSPGGLGGLAGRRAAVPCVVLVAAARRVRAAEAARGLVIALPPDVRALFDRANTARVPTLMRDGAPHSVRRHDAEGCE